MDFLIEQNKLIEQMNRIAPIRAVTQTNTTSGGRRRPTAKIAPAGSKSEPSLVAEQASRS